MRKQRNDLGDLTGQTFGRLTVRCYVGTDKHQKRVWNCACSCGNLTDVTTTQLRLGKTQSCGCFKTDLHTTHGDCESPEYYAWRSMRNRCEDPSTKYFDKYGGRGIAVCQRWSEYQNFLDDMGRKPSKQYSLERENNDGNYEPANCKWATKSEQTRNRSVTVFVEHAGRRMLVQDWAKELGMPYTTLYSRLRNGWSIDRAFNTPKKDSK